MLGDHQFARAFEECAGALEMGVREAKDAQAVRVLAAQVIEQIWRQAETAGRQERLTAMPNWGERPLQRNEINALLALINYQADNLGISAFAIETEVLALFGVSGLDAIKAWNFDEIIRYLTEFDCKLKRDKDQAGSSER